MKGMIKKCPKCGTISKGKRNVKRDFGLRTVNGVERPQSYCKDCKRKFSRKNSMPVVSKKKKATKKKAVAKKKVIKKAPVVKPEVLQPLIKVTPNKRAQMFEPTNVKTGYILKISKSKLQDMLDNLRGRSSAIAIGVDIKKVSR